MIGKRASEGRTLVLGQLVQLHEAGRDGERHVALALQILELANGVRVRAWWADAEKMQLVLIE